MSRATAQSDNLAIVVRKNEAEAAIREICRDGLLDVRRKVLVRQSSVEIPVTASDLRFTTIFQDQPEFYKRRPRLEDILKDELDPEQIELLPRGWFILGEVIIVKIPSQLDPQKHLIGQALLSIYPRCKSVLRDFGIDGQMREPLRELIAGEASETVHLENGVRFKLDARKIMFSQGNLRERMRIGCLGRDESVVDMFAGIGYFSLPMAVHSRPKEILAIEINPTAYRYLVENAKLNCVRDIVRPVLGDCAEMTPRGEADRVIMGLVGATSRYLGTGMQALKHGGVLHYHQTIPSWLYPQALLREVIDAARSLGLAAHILSCRKVKKYSPGVVHAVVDACIGRDR